MFLFPKSGKDREKNNFNISSSNNQLTNLFNVLVRYDLIITERTKDDDFVKVLKEAWHAHKSKVHFKLNNPSCREFHELFKLTFSKNSLTIDRLLQKV